MKSSQIVIVTAMLLAAACAGIILVDEESDAVAVGTITSVSYTDGDGNTRTTAIENDVTTLTILTPEAAGIPSEGFLYWTTESGVVYNPDSTIAVAGIADGDVNEGVFTLTAEYEEPSTTVDFIGNDEELIGAGQTPGSVTVPEAPAVAGMHFIGWLYSGDGKIYQVYDGEAPEGVKDDIADVKDTAKAGETFTAQYIPVYTVSWVVDGATIATGDTVTTNQPVDPSKEHYTFIEWKDANGVAYSEDYEFTGATTFTAVFEANLITVTFVAGEQTVGTVEVRYGNTVNALALPEGYSAWAVDAEGTAAFDFSKAITEEITIYAVAAPIDETIYATFNIEGTIYGPYKVTDRFSIPQTDREGYDFLGWTIQGGDGTLLTSAQVQNYQYTEDVTFIANYVAVEPPAPEEPGFFETTTGQAAIVLVVFVIVLFVAAVYMNIGGLREKLFGWKITRKD